MEDEESIIPANIGESLEIQARVKAADMERLEHTREIRRSVFLRTIETGVTWSATVVVARLVHHLLPT